MIQYNSTTSHKLNYYSLKNQKRFTPIPKNKHNQNNNQHIITSHNLCSLMTLMNHKSLFLVLSLTRSYKHNLSIDQLKKHKEQPRNYKKKLIVQTYNYWYNIGLKRRPNNIKKHSNITEKQAKKEKLLWQSLSIKKVNLISFILYAYMNTNIEIRNPVILKQTLTDYEKI